MKKKAAKTRARLIAVDGADGRAVTEHAERLARTRGGIKGISRCDASGLFEQLVADDDQVVTSPRILLLLYAADLAFRLRWELEPALADGDNVIAAPYIQTAMAFGRASGLSPKWLNGLFRFARKATESHAVSARTPSSSRRISATASGASSTSATSRRKSRDKAASASPPTTARRSSIKHTFPWDFRSP